MNDFASAFHIAFELIGSFNAELRAIILLSLQVSLTASVCAFAIGAPLGTALAVYRFPGRGQFIDWLVSPEGQRAIADYKINGEQLFYPNANDPNA